MRQALLKCFEYIVHIDLILTRKLWGKYYYYHSHILDEKKKFLQKVSNLPKLIMVKAGFEYRHSDSKALSLTHFTVLPPTLALHSLLLWYDP